jgi:hypothetical protein
LNVQGAPNFRGPHEEGLNVYGVAQPTVPGLKSILTILSCQPQPEPERVVVQPELTPASSVEDNLTAGSAPVSRRRSSAQPLVEQGHTIWFSTREETLGELLW